MREKAAVCLAVAALAVALGGCGKKDPNLPDLVPVSGTVTVDGQPLAEGVVYFSPVGETRGVPAFGRTDAQGRYTLGSDKLGKGTPVGEYRVTIGKAVSADGSTPGGKDFDPMTDAGTVRQLLPPKFSDPSATTLTATVEEGGKEIDFDLKTK